MSTVTARTAAFCAFTCENACLTAGSATRTHTRPKRPHIMPNAKFVRPLMEPNVPE